MFEHSQHNTESSGELTGNPEEPQKSFSRSLERPRNAPRTPRRPRRGPKGPREVQKRFWRPNRGPDAFFEAQEKPGEAQKMPRRDPEEAKQDPGKPKRYMVVGRN